MSKGSSNKAKAWETFQRYGKIPYNKEFVNALVNLKPAVVYNKRFKTFFIKILEKLKTKDVF